MVSHWKVQILCPELPKVHPIEKYFFRMGTVLTLKEGLQCPDRLMKRWISPDTHILQTPISGAMVHKYEATLQGWGVFSCHEIELLCVWC